jgi:hypothetical protein
MYSSYSTMYGMRVLIVLLCLLTCNFFINPFERNSNWEIFGYNGMVKTSRHLHFSIIPGNGKAIYEGSTDLEFSSAGSLLKVVTRNSDDFITSEINYRNNNTSRITEKREVDKTGTEIVSTYKMKENGVPEKVVISVNKKRYTRTFVPVSSFEIIEDFSELSLPGKSLTVTSLRSEDGKIKEKILSLKDFTGHSDSIHIARTLFSRNEQGDVIIRRDLDNLDRVISIYSFEYRYDKNGNKIEIKELIQRNERHTRRLHKITKIQYTYWN